MAYCKSCGSYIPDADEVCPACGILTAEAEAQAAATAKETAERRAAVTAQLELGDKKSRKTEYGEAKERRETRRAGMSGEYKAPEREQARKERDFKADRQSKSGEYRAEYNADASENESLGVLCYLGPLLLIPLLTKPDSSFLRYHCNQGLLLAIFCLLTQVCGVIPIIGWIGSVAGWVIGIKGLITGIENVKNGKRSPLPYFGDITIIK